MQRIHIYIFHFSQADRAGLEKAPRWRKFAVKVFKTKTCLDFVILSLSLSLERERWVKCLMANNVEWHQQKNRVSQETFQQKNAG